jgi:hypothetical protein
MYWYPRACGPLPRLHASPVLTSLQALGIFLRAQDCGWWKGLPMHVPGLDAQVIFKNLQHMHENSLPPTGALCQCKGGWSWAACNFKLKARDHTRVHTGGRNGRLVGWRMWWSLGTDNDPPVDST